MLTLVCLFGNTCLAWKIDCFIDLMMGAKENAKSPGLVFSLSIPKMAFMMCSLPAIGMLSAVALSVINDFEESTATHCRVKNYLPSISASIGGFTPQRYIWRICIALHCGPRFMTALAYYNHYMSYTVVKRRGLFQKLALTVSGLHLIENLCLVFLSMISSNENFHVHENSFIVFLVTSQVYMFLTLILHKWSRLLQDQLSSRDRKSFRLKMLFFIINISATFTAVYFYIRHNKYCEPGIYSLFALCEYIIVMSNIFFHGYSTSLDFYNTDIKMESTASQRKSSDIMDRQPLLPTRWNHS